MGAVRKAERSDAGEIGRLLHDFNTEYEDVTPGPHALEERIGHLLDQDTEVLLTGEPAEGLAVLRFRSSIWTPGLECYLAELYVVPELRGQGRGRALLEAALDLARERGADYVELNTSADDVAARALYERLGFRNSERPGGPVSYYYEREL